jgi:septal ring factor EnvC (AmiA/AmiB activator)
MQHFTAYTGTRLRWRYALATLIFSLLPLMAHAAAIDAEPTENDEAAVERERAYAERLRRAIEKSEQEQSDYARRRDSEQSRQTEFTRLQSRIAVLERDESTLQGQMRNAETQLVYMRRDPADMSAHARRSELESRVSYYRSQLHHIFAEKQTALRQINELRFRN